MFPQNAIYFLLIGLLFGAIVVYARRKVLSQPHFRQPDRPFPNEWRRILNDKVAFYNRLSGSEKQEFERKVHIFLLNVRITGANTEVTHEDRILVASGAVIPIFRFEHWHYMNLREVEIHPEEFEIPTKGLKAHGLTGWGAMEGKMMLSRKALQHGFADQTDNKNVAIHEFMHILDKQDGKMDGVMMQVMKEVDISPWLYVINNKIGEISTGEAGIRAYGATNEAEFLAVVSEYFFENPDHMRSEHPDLYNALDSFFNPKHKRVNRSFYRKAYK